MGVERILVTAEPDNRPVVLYHQACPDGHTAAWVSWKANNGNVNLIPVAYDKEPPDVKGKTVYMFDFSYKRKVLEQLRRDAASLLVFDHHKSAQEDLKGLDYCMFDMERSGAQLAWDFWMNTKPRHWLVDYTATKDLWKWDLPSSHEVNDAICSYPMTIETWEELYKRSVDSMIVEGQVVGRFKKKMIEEAVNNAYEIEMAGHKILCANVSTKEITSEVGHELCKGKPFAAIWVDHHGKRYWGLRSDDNGADVSKIAEEYGGGGHFSASGFVEDLGMDAVDGTLEDKYAGMDE